MNNNLICGHGFFVIVDRYIQRAGKVGCCNWKTLVWWSRQSLCGLRRGPGGVAKEGMVTMAWCHLDQEAQWPQGPMLAVTQTPLLLSGAHHIPLILQLIPTTSHFEEFHLPIICESFYKCLILSFFFLLKKIISYANYSLSYYFIVKAKVTFYFIFAK